MTPRPPETFVRGDVATRDPEHDRVHRQRPQRRPLSARGYNAAARLDVPEDVLDRLGRSHDIVREVEDNSIGLYWDLGRFDRRLDKRDVVPAGTFDPHAGLPKHLRTQVDADDATVWPDLFLKQGEAQSSTTSDVEDDIARPQP